MKEETFDSLKRGLQDAIAYQKGDQTRGRAHRVRSGDINVKTIRSRLHMTQHEFADQFGISLSTLRKWETSNRIPEGPAKAYLTVIGKNPQAVIQALSGV